MILAVHRLGLALASNGEANTVWLYSVRLAAFVIILAAIVDKNRTVSEQIAVQSRLEIQLRNSTLGNAIVAGSGRSQGRVVRASA